MKARPLTKSSPPDYKTALSRYLNYKFQHELKIKSNSRLRLGSVLRK